MKQYLFKVALFLFPVVLIAAALEIYLKTSESTYLLKSNSFKKNNNTVLVLGSSHNQNAINPTYLNAQSCNASNGSQDLKIDLALFKKALEVNDSLKILILEMSYHRFRENPDKYWRNGLYEYFYQIDLTKGFNPARYFLLGSNLKFFRNFFGDLLSTRNHIYKYNEYGFDENDFEGAFKQLQYDENAIKANAKSRLTIDDWMTPDSMSNKRNWGYLDEINKLCVKNNVQLVLVAPPVYETYSSFFKESNLKMREDVIARLRVQNPGLLWLNYENSPQFNLKLFKNDDHLNADGARLFTQQLSDTLHLQPGK